MSDPTAATRPAMRCRVWWAALLLATFLDTHNPGGSYQPLWSAPIVASSLSRPALPMGYPRALLETLDTTDTYHCVSCCVRRASLCGDDELSGWNFDHRKQRLEDRLIELAEVFSISVLVFAVA